MVTSTVEDAQSKAEECVVGCLQSQPEQERSSIVAAYDYPMALLDERFVIH